MVTGINTKDFHPKLCLLLLFSWNFNVPFFKYNEISFYKLIKKKLYFDLANRFGDLKLFVGCSSMFCAWLSETGALTFVDLCPPKRLLFDEIGADVTFGFIGFTSGSNCLSSWTGFCVTTNWWRKRKKNKF